MVFKQPMSLGEYPAFRRKLLAGSGVLIALLVLAFLWTLYGAIQKDRQAARVQTKTFARAIDSHVSYTIESMNLSLASFANAAQALSSEGNLDVMLIERLLSRSRDINGHFWLMFIDSKGMGVAASNEIDVYGLSFADRDYFMAHLGGNDRKLYVSVPHIDPMTRRPLVAISRRVENGAGKFLGVIVAPINAKSFAAMFDNARYDEGTTITLTHRSGKVIARSPLFEQSFGTDVSSGEHVRNKASTGTKEARSQVDGKPRIYSYRSIEGLPLIVSVGVDNPLITDSAALILLAGGLGVLMMIVVIAGSCHLVLKSYRNLERLVQARTGELHRSQIALRNLAAHQNRVKEKERTRIAQEVHDELGGCLTGIKAYISAAAANPSDTRNSNQSLLSEASKLTDIAVDTVRRVITDLRPSVLDQLGIWAALEWYADQFEQRTGIPCELLLHEVRDLEVDYDMATMIFRIVQESLTNVARHSQASRVVILGRQEAGRIVIEVEDDGIGIAAEELLGQDAWGIMGMHERARHAGGELKVTGAKARGTVVSLYLPEMRAQESGPGTAETWESRPM
jgi:signal transduction histidine kinase